MVVKPGDLVMLKNRPHYSGVDVADSRFIDVPGGSIGVYIGSITDSQYTIYDLVLTGGEVVKCGQGVWSVLDEAG